MCIESQVPTASLDRQCTGKIHPSRVKITWVKDDDMKWDTAKGNSHEQDIQGVHEDSQVRADSPRH